jgi:uncharacterized protein (DUF305 family)
MKPMFRIISTSAFLAASLVAPMAHAQQAAAPMDMKAMMKKDHDKMESMPMTGKPDVDFAMMMREHHAGALTMADWELKNGKDAGMRDMAKKIIASQKKEIAQFDAFLAKNGQGGADGKGHAGHTPAK